jgi:hypothetical protein
MIELMSECESMSGSEIPEDSDCDSFDSEYHPKTIPLHPCLRHGKTHLITKENKDTIEQTAENAVLTVEDWGPSIAYVKDEFITYDLCKRAIENHDGAICSIKPHLLKKEEYYNLCLESVSENGWNMKYVPKEVQTQELIDAAIESICWAIQFSKDEFKTYENCTSAVRRNGQTLEHVPRHFIDKEMCILAAKSRYPCINLIPKEFLTKEICEMAVKADGENIKYVPEEFMSTELGWIAIRSPAPSHPSSDMARSNIRYIPGKFLTKDLIVESAKHWYSTYGLIPKDFITEEIEDAVLEVSPYCLKFMKQTPERCMKAMKLCPDVLADCIEIDNITSEIVEYFESLPDKTKGYTKRICSDEKLKHIYSLIKNKVEPKRDKILESCKEAYWNYYNIPEEFITDELNKEILKVAPYCIRCIEQTPENCMIAIKGNPLVAQDSIEKFNLTREMAEYIVGLPDESREEFMEEDLYYFKLLLQK